MTFLYSTVRYHTRTTISIYTIDMVGWVLKKIFFLVLIVAGAFYLYQTYGATFLSKNSPQTKKLTDNVLGTATKVATDQVSKSTSFLGMIVFKEATKPVIDQYNKLPKNKQEEIKKQICK